MSSFILHIARRSEWVSSSSDYRPSAFEREGFIHCSYPHQCVGAANRHFKGERDLMLLRIDAEAVKGILKVENEFPHLYGALPRSAVIEESPFNEGDSGFVLPARAGSSIFCKILRGEIPSYKIYEDDLVFSFLTRDAIRPGHSLIVPKVEVDHFSDVPEPYYSAVFSVARKLSRAIADATGCDRVGAIIAGFEIPHFHLHLIPTDDMSDLEFRNAKVRSHEENVEVQKKILANLAVG